VWNYALVACIQPVKLIAIKFAVAYCVPLKFESGVLRRDRRK